MGAIKRLRDNDQLNRRALVEISEFSASADADIEDLFEPDSYLDLVNQAYAQDLPAPITPADLNPHDPRIVRQVGTYFQDKNIAGGRSITTGLPPSCCASRQPSSRRSAPLPSTRPTCSSSGSTS